jgi:asparagine synthase (glutamine-hydrolysing)
MCGFAGFFGSSLRTAATAGAMLDELAKRGPDAQHAVFWDEKFRPTEVRRYHGLLSTRLAIIDPRPEADQPMANDRGDVWISYNGEVYDWQADAAVLRNLGAKFRTRSDTEFILRAYEQWGIECLSRLRGMFALAIFDLRSRVVYVARDRMGLKPVVYGHRGGDFFFGSTVRSVLPMLAPTDRGFSVEGIDAYLAHRYIPAPRTVFENLQRLENAHYLRYELDGGKLDKVCYWQPEARSGDWLDVLDQAIEMRTVADRPVGVYLSGGIDSSAIACGLAKHGHHDLSSFTAAFSDPRFDESADAARTARALDIPNVQVPIPASVREHFSRIVADLDEPFADPSSIPSWFLARETTKHVKVVLGGDGGDEVFAGYKRYGKHLRWRRGFNLPWLPQPESVAGRGLAKLSAELRVPWLDAYALRFSGFAPGQRRYLAGGKSPPQAVYWRMGDAGQRAPLAALLEIDRLNYLPEYVLRKADLCTMAHGLELRAPLLDHRWYEIVMGLPAAERFTRPPKLLLRGALQAVQSLHLFERKKKGFNPPLALWLREDLSERFAGLGARLARLSDGLIAAERADALVARYLGGVESLGEGVLQLLFLDESLAQLDKLRQEAYA